MRAYDKNRGRETLFLHNISRKRAVGAPHDTENVEMDIHLESVGEKVPGKIVYERVIRSFMCIDIIPYQR